MGCNCNKTHNISMGCCVPVLGPIENYYTKYQTDLRIEEEISGLTGSSSGCCITPEEVDEKISAATDGMATEQWVETQGYITGVDLSDYAKLEDIPYSDIEAISGNVNTVSGDVITLSGEVASITASGMTSGQVQTMIDNSISGKQDTLIAGDYITIDTANTISTSGLVTVVDNEVPAFRAENLVRYNEGYPSSSGQQYYYTTSTEAALIWYSIGDGSYTYKTKIQVIDTGNTKTSGETAAIRARNMTTTNINPLPDYITVENVGTRKYTFRAKEGYRISHISSQVYWDGDPFGYENVYAIETPIAYISGQSEHVIENEIYPQLASKANKIQAGNGIIIIRDVVNSADTINVDPESTITSASTYAQVPSARAVYNALRDKADTTYVNNNFMAKSQIWCGTEADFAQISGSTTNGTIYLVY